MSKGIYTINTKYRRKESRKLQKSRMPKWWDLLLLICYIIVKWFAAIFHADSLLHWHPPAGEYELVL
jgi:polyferredoxin